MTVTAADMDVVTVNSDAKLLQVSLPALSAQAQYSVTTVAAGVVLDTGTNSNPFAGICGSSHDGGISTDCTDAACQ